uniref:Uncharacterized protein n=1 Tax=Serratia marcescens TaxID=615 RepID=A0A345INQ4_SERMA|nr:hypothetical protein [Serratia marcescens]
MLSVTSQPDEASFTVRIDVSVFFPVRLLYFCRSSPPELEAFIE